MPYQYTAVATAIPIGTRFGRLTVLSPAARCKARPCFLVRCDCGTEKVIQGRHLMDGTTHSCGCLSIERSRIHGASSSPEFPIWCSMRQRCQNPADKGFHNYGGRGIAVDPTWGTFAQFLADMGPRPSPKHSIERVDNDGPYAPWNCVWATQSDQSRNQRKNIWLTYNGETRILKDWASHLGLNYTTIYGRWQRGWSAERILSHHHAGPM